ncbi:2-isopropylmalate synthase [subsurface metagenome]
MYSALLSQGLYITNYLSKGVEMKKILIYDTTLRDGTQSEGISFSVEDKLKIAKRLDDLGIHYIEGGWPGSNPKDILFFKRAKNLRLKNAKIVPASSLTSFTR